MLAAGHGLKGLLLEEPATAVNLQKTAGREKFCN
jgi:hypothetical protein